MNLEIVDKDFNTLIRKRGIHKTLGTSSEHIRNLRYKVKNRLPVSTDLKLLLLKKSGWRQADKNYDRHDLVELVKFVLKAGAAAKELGPEYLVDKWECSAA